ncbi:type IV secretion system protein VirB10 [Sphingobium yanoikuyae]|uniref:type IV secretion system protein VirB10 n=1 Tax=Sphingobium yanoikuyae TaxID=13690 RepID=UPI00068CE84F|nr:type IV secretion system protein VirB10 [Sphingobium yanoikuyae]MDV3480061.1 type IV secretion system protein VirB10 [Sphingobium yanoikuyae]
MTDEPQGAAPAGPASAPPPPTSAGIAGERHVSEVAGRPIVSKRAGIGVIVAGTAIAIGVILLTSARPNLKTQQPPPPPVHSDVQYVPPPLPVAPAVLPAASPPPLPDQPATAPAPAGGAPVQHRSELLVYTSGGGLGGRSGPGAGLMSPDPNGARNGVQGGAAPGADGEGGSATVPAAIGGAAAVAGREGGNDLGSRLTPTRLTGVSANVLRNQPFLLTTGTMIPCVLQTAMDSTLPGLVTCVIPQDVLGKTGLTLFDRGTRVVGEFKGGIQQGVERMFVVWTRAETPQGVVINLDSPATDPLGRSGMDGAVDRHFWQRFGGALLLTTVDGAMQAGIAAASKSGTTTINTGSTEGVIASSLAGTINLAPTIRKHQGELVSILVARDLDFSTVYGVRPTAQGYARAMAAGAPRP